MVDRAHELTDIEIARIKRHLLSVYRRAEKSVTVELKKYAETIKKKSDVLLKAIDEAETEADKKAAKSAYKRFYMIDVKRDIRFAKVAEIVAETIYKANVEAAAYINTKTAHIYTINYNQIGGGLQKDLDGYKFKPVSEEDADKYGEITRQTVDKKKDKRWNERNVSQSVLTGALLLYGASKIFDMAAKNTTKKNLDSAHRQASDMMTDAASKGRLDSMYRAYDEGFTVKKYWIAILDNKTRDTHIEYDSMEPVDLDYEYADGLKRPKDSRCSIMAEVCNCRCDLGYDTGRGKAATRTAREGEVTGSYKTPSSFEGTQTINIPQMTYKEWMKWRSK